MEGHISQGLITEIRAIAVLVKVCFTFTGDYSFKDKM